MNSRSGMLGLALGLVLCSGAQASAPPSLTLSDALLLTLERSPAVRIERSLVALQRGVALESEAAFDPVLSFDAEFSYIQERLTERTLKNLREQREDIETGIERLRTQRANLEERIEEFNQAIINPFGVQLGDLDAQQFLELLNALILAAPDEEERLRLQSLRGQALLEVRDVLSANRDRLIQDENTEIERLRKLGEVPSKERDVDSSVNLSYRQAYRNGWQLEAFYSLTQTGTNFVGKPIDVEFGGKGFIDLYRSRIGARVLVPLGRGRDDLALAEQAASAEAEAAAVLLQQQVAGIVLNTVQAYWDLVAAQLRRDVLQESLQRQQRLLALVDALIQADQIPAAEIARVRAREAEASAQLNAADEALVRARLGLARNIGLELNSLDEAPLAADSFPRPVEIERLRAVNGAALLPQALQRRSDLQAASRSLDAAGIRLDAAQRNLRSRHDLSAGISFSGVGEDMSVANALDDAVIGRYTGPSWTIGYSFDRPRHNLFARGRVMQAEAELMRGQALRDDVERGVRNGVLLGYGVLADTAAQVEALRLAVGDYLLSIANERERLEAGVSTSLDSILTEERLTGAVLASIGAERQYAGLLAQLRFELGELLHADGERFELRAADLVFPAGLDR